jgi:hypothetical protein
VTVFLSVFFFIAFCFEFLNLLLVEFTALAFTHRPAAAAAVVVVVVDDDDDDDDAVAAVLNAMLTIVS